MSAEARQAVHFVLHALAAAGGPPLRRTAAGTRAARLAHRRPRSGVPPCGGRRPRFRPTGRPHPRAARTATPAGFAYGAGGSVSQTTLSDRTQGGQSDRTQGGQSDPGRGGQGDRTRGGQSDRGRGGQSDHGLNHDGYALRHLAEGGSRPRSGMTGNRPVECRRRLHGDPVAPFLGFTRRLPFPPGPQAGRPTSDSSA
jgi:hypothetical protein